MYPIIVTYLLKTFTTITSTKYPSIRYMNPLGYDFGFRASGSIMEISLSSQATLELGLHIGL